MRGWLLRSSLGMLMLAALALHSGPAAAQTCVGDCDNSGAVAVSELILGVDILLGLQNVSACPGLADGSGSVTVSRLIIAVNNALCGCGNGSGCAVAPPVPSTPTATGPPTEPTPTPTGPVTESTATPTTEVASVSTWMVDDYNVASSNCFSLLQDAVEGSLRAVGSRFTVRESGNRAEIDYGDNNVIVGSVDPDGTVHAQESSNESAGPCDYNIAVSASANLSNSPTTATYNANVNLSGFCLGLSDCKMKITSQWTRVDNSSSND